jgi:DNA-binding CsgD family transcriptional regulator
MHIRAERFLHLQTVIDLLVAPLPGDELRRRLAEPMLRLMEADFYASYAWDDGAGRFARGVAVNVNPAHERRYEERFQFLDPLTPRLRERRLPTRATDVMPQRALQASEFFNEFLRPDGLHWGLNAYAHDGSRHLGDLRIWRCQARPNFDDDDLGLLRLIYPALVTALGRDAAPTTRNALPPCETLAAALVRHQLLSPREADVAALAAEGCADKDIARRLGIGFTTVRTHLASAFRKLDCEGRTQLAHRLAQLKLK